MRSKRPAGYTLVELLMVVTIAAIVTSITTPRMKFLVDRAYQGRSRTQLGVVRTALGIYYSDTSGTTAFLNHPGGAAHTFGVSLSDVLVPKYIERIPTPRLADYFEYPPGVKYDDQVKVLMSQTPPHDVFFAAGPPDAILVSMPLVYNTEHGEIYYCNGNQDTTGQFFYNW